MSKKTPAKMKIFQHEKKKPCIELLSATCIELMGITYKFFRELAISIIVANSVSCRIASKHFSKSALLTSSKSDLILDLY